MDLDTHLDERADYVPRIIHVVALNDLKRARDRIAELEQTVRALTREGR